MIGATNVLLKYNPENSIIGKGRKKIALETNYRKYLRFPATPGSLLFHHKVIIASDHQKKHNHYCSYQYQCNHDFGIAGIHCQHD